MNFYKHFLGDYARDTAHLSMLEHGAYRLMLDHYYATGKTLPAEPFLLYRICKASSKTERAAVDLVRDSFFPLNGDGTRHNKRADKEIAQWEAQAAVNRVVGKLGGRPKKTESVPENNRIVTESGTEQKPNDNPSHSHSQIPEIENTKSTSKVPRHPVDLPEWLPTDQWQAYLEMRQRIRKPATRYAQGMAIAKLKELREQGEHPAAVLGQSIMNSWQGIFPLKNGVKT